MEKALIAMHDKYASLAKARRNKVFRDAESRILGYVPDDYKQFDYLRNLRKRVGNTEAALAMSKAGPRLLAKWREEEWFVKREQYVLRSLKSRVDEEMLQVALGSKRAKNRDSAHLRHVAAKLNKEMWGDTPKTIIHEHKGSVDMKVLDDKIARLLGGDVVDAELVE